MNDSKAVRLFEIADTAGMKAAFDQLEAEFPTGNVGRARVWFALKCVLRDEKSLPDVLAQLKKSNERAEFLYSSSARLVRENRLMPEAFEALPLSERERRGVQVSIVNALAEDARFPEAMKIFSALPKSDERAGALLNVVEGYARSDAVGAMALVKNLEGEDRREARSVLVTVYREKGYADGLRSMLLDSQDDAEKQRLVSSIVKAYGTYRDNVSASQFVDSLDGSLQEAGKKALTETFR